MADTSDYSKVIDQAEKAVSSVKDEALRKIAFEKLLTHLLSGNSAGTFENAAEPAKKTRKASTKHTTKKSTGKTSGPLSWLRELVEEGFFKKPKSSSDIRQELETRDHHLQATDLTAPLRILCNDKLLRRKKMSPEKGSKAVLHWVNW